MFVIIITGKTTTGDVLFLNFVEGIAWNDKKKRIFTGCLMQLFQRDNNNQLSALLDDR